MSEPQTQAERVLFQKDQYYEQATKLVRWLAIAVVILTFPIGSSKWIYVLAIVAAATIYNLARYAEPLMKLRFFASKINMLVMDNIFVALLVSLTGGIHSPYLLFFAFMITSSAFWYGLVGLGLVVAFQVVATAVMFIVPISPYTPTTLDLVVTFVLTTGVEGILVERLTHVERQERYLASESRNQLESERQRLLGFINSLADAALAVDATGSITLYNGATLDLLNTNDSLSGKKLDQLLPLVDQGQTTLSIMEIAAKTTGNQKRNDLVYLSRDGSKVNLDLSIAPIHSTQSGREVRQGYVLILRDITKEKTLEQQRDEFISVASHELRTPLAIAEANISTALLPSLGKIDPKVRQLLVQAHQNVVFLGDLIRDLTTLSRVEQGELPVDLKLVEPRELLEQLGRDYRSEIEAKGLTLKIETSPKLAPILTSEYRVHEILQNFITNAIKYTKTGTVGLLAQAAKDQPADIVFAVKDNGIGIGDADKKHIFQKFFRSEDYRTRETGGSGLGLYIAQRLAERLNGKIWYESQINRGSTFYLQVPPFSQRKEDHKQVVDAQMQDFVSQL